MQFKRYWLDYIIWIFQDIIALFSRNNIFVCGFFKRRSSGYIHNNWGDDINIYFLESILNLRVRVINNSHLYKFIKPCNYSCIGSVIGYFTNRKTIIWGSGLVSQYMDVPYKPQKICSVRGPLTRQILLEKGIECPPIYGDPALLVSRFYKPTVRKKYKLGIIPHVIDVDNEHLKKFSVKHPDVLIISMSEYEDWHEIPDLICSCDKIISSSLHGLIISDSYDIPNIWVRFSEDIVGGNFKYLDYFASVKRDEKMPVFIDSLERLEDIESRGRYNLAKHIDYLSILESCPFKSYIKNYDKYVKSISNCSSL